MQSLNTTTKLPRRSGLLMPIFSLPSKYGIGNFGLEAFRFIDFLKEAGQSYWQILPLGTTGYGNSPYQNFSSFAGNPYFIDFDQLIEFELLYQNEVDEVPWDSENEGIQYGVLYEYKRALLKSAYRRFLENSNQELLEKQKEFIEKNRHWLFAFACFMTLKEKLNGTNWQEWPDQYKFYDEYQLTQFAQENRIDIEYYYFEQFLFFDQWNKVKQYANEKGIKIIGDLPIYVAMDSVDVWSNPDLFCLDENLLPTEVAGCPPDYFAEDGQLWGNPLYNWEKMEEINFSWWIERLGFNFTIYDIVRIDHFRGFEAYWSVPYGDETAKNGQWNKGPDHRFFDAVYSVLGDVPIIAEDLGFLTDEVYQLRDDFELPGMAVLQFAFEETMTSDYLPHNLNRNSIMYTGTHDNSTLMGWLQNEDEEIIALGKEYFGCPDFSLEDTTQMFMHQAMTSVSDTCILTVQDLLLLGDEARINEPGTSEKNWEWRIKPDQLTTIIAEKLYRLTKISGRLSQEQ